MTYIMTVNQASRLRIEGANSSEVVRGGLRSVLYDPSGLYAACSNSGATDASAINLAVPPILAITTKCTTTATRHSGFPRTSAGRWRRRWSVRAQPFLRTTPTHGPTWKRWPISEQWSASTVTDSVPCRPAVPGNNQTDPMVWHVMPDNATDTSTGGKIFLPYLHR